jgi:hypothetical protein
VDFPYFRFSPIEPASWLPKLLEHLEALAPGFNLKRAAGSTTIANRSVDAVALRAILSKLHVGIGLVRISAGMVGILLNSCALKQKHQRITVSLQAV